TKGGMKFVWPKYLVSRSRSSSPGPPQARLYRARSQTQYLCRFVNRETFNVSQREDDAQARAKFSHGLREDLAQFRRPIEFLGIGSPIADFARQVVSPSFTVLLKRLLLGGTPLPQFHERLVQGDPNQPRREPRVFPEGTQMLEGLQEAFLHDVLGIFPIMG